MMYTLVGDVHGKMEEFASLVGAAAHPVIQLGDLGVGFADTKPLIGLEFGFIHGNHDNPGICRAMPQFLGRAGSVGSNGFFVSGAWSIDYMKRLPGLDWWPEEELGFNEQYDAYDMYMDMRPDVVISHDCPLSVYRHVGVRHQLESQTALFLEGLLEAHRPSQWVFAHHHRSADIEYKGTRFICLNELETCEVDM